MNFDRIQLPIALLAAFACCSLARAVPPVNSPAYKVDGHVGYNAGNRAEIPPGTQLTVIVSDAYASNPKEAQLVQWFNTDPALVALTQKAQLKTRPAVYTASTYDKWAAYWAKAPASDPGWNLYLQSNPHYTERLSKHFGGPPPIVSLQAKSGQWLMKISGSNIPATAGELADLCYDAIAEANPTPKFPGQEWNQVVDEKGDGVPPLCSCVNCECPDCPHNCLAGQCPGPGPCPLVKPDQTPVPGIPDILPARRVVREVKEYAVPAVAAVAGGAVVMATRRRKGGKKNGFSTKG